MKRATILVLLVGLLSACGAGQTTQPTGQTPVSGQTQPTGPTQPSDAGGAGATSLVEAAAKVKDVCTLLPTDLAAKIVVGGTAPESQLFPPLRCRVSNGTSVLEITLAVFDAVDPLVPNESIPGLGAGAYLQTQFIDDSYLKVLLSKEQGALYVEVAGHDKKDHKDDAIAVAKAVLAKLH